MPNNNYDDLSILNYAQETKTTESRFFYTGAKWVKMTQLTSAYYRTFYSQVVRNKQ